MEDEMNKKCPKCNKDHELISWGITGYVLTCDCGTIQFYKNDGTLDGAPIFSNAAKRRAE